MKIDVFTHVVPKKYKEALLKKTKVDLSTWCAWVIRNRALSEIDVRLRVMDRYPDVMNVLVPALAPLEVFASPGDAVELAKLNNDETAELVAKYPDRFIAGVALLPLNDIEAAVKEADRAITELGLRGVLIHSNINGEPLDAPKFRVLYARMAQHDLPIWIHPWYLPVTTGQYSEGMPEPIKEYFKQRIITPFQWPLDTALAMVRLALSGVFEDYPNIKFITHHLGGVLPMVVGRTRLENTRKFYNDTAVRGAFGALQCGYDFFGVDHVLFGTDFPQGSTGMGAPMPGALGCTLETIRLIERLDIPAADKDKIFIGNALRLLKTVL